MSAFTRQSDGLLKQTKKIEEGTICKVTLVADEAEAAQADKIYLQPSFVIAEVSKPIASKKLNQKRKVSFSFEWSNSVCFYYVLDRTDGSEKPEPIYNSQCPRGRAHLRVNFKTSN